jgi:predicted ATP-grasp superfamily ATP-dependent carboligase
VTVPVIILGGGINGLAIARSLGREKIPVHVFAEEANDIAASSRYVSALEQVDVSDSGSVIKTLKRVASGMRVKPVMLCAADNFLEIVASHRQELDEIIVINLPESSVVDTVIDKGMFGEFAARFKLPVPRSWEVETDADIAECAGQVQFPVVIKPVFAHAGVEEKFQEDGVDAKMILARTAAELTSHFDVLSATTDRLLIQEYIHGVDSEHYSYCVYRNAAGKELAGVGVRKIRLLPIHGGAGTFVEVCEDAELIEKSRRIIDALGYTGVSSVCCKRHAETGRLLAHEVNGRFPMWHGISGLASTDLPYIAYRDMIGTPMDVHQRSAGDRKWMAFRSDISSFRGYRRAGELSILKWLLSLRKVRMIAEYSTDDWRPFLYTLRMALARAFGAGPRA